LCGPGRDRGGLHPAGEPGQRAVHQEIPQLAVSATARHAWQNRAVLVYWGKKDREAPSMTIIPKADWPRRLGPAGDLGPLAGGRGPHHPAPEPGTEPPAAGRGARGPILRGPEPLDGRRAGALTGRGARRAQRCRPAAGPKEGPYVQHHQKSAGSIPEKADAEKAAG